MTATPSPARGEVRAAEVLADAYGGDEREAAEFADEALAALLALAPDAEGVAVMRDGSVLAVEATDHSECAHTWSHVPAPGPCNCPPLYRLTPPRREEQDRGADT